MHLNIRSLKPHSQVVRITCDHILLVVRTHKWPGLHTEDRLQSTHSQWRRSDKYLSEYTLYTLIINSFVTEIYMPTSLYCCFRGELHCPISLKFLSVFQLSVVSLPSACSQRKLASSLWQTCQKSKTYSHPESLLSFSHYDSLTQRFSNKQRMCFLQWKSNYHIQITRRACRVQVSLYIECEGEIWKAFTRDKC